MGEGGSMLIWQQTVRELRLLLEHQGAFRDVRTWTLNTSMPDRVVLHAGPHHADRKPRELVDPSGRRVIIIASDCLGPAWFGTAAAEILRTLGVHNPVVLWQMLPQPVWRQTALRSAQIVHVSATEMVAPNHRLHSELWRPLPDEEIARGLALPVVTAESHRVRAWARLLSGAPRVRLPAVIMRPTLPPEEGIEEDEDEIPADLAPPSPERRILDFRKNASPPAFKLACLLAGAPLRLPIMRLVQRTMLPNSEQIHLAEVFLSGLIERVTAEDAPVDPDFVDYDFCAGIRDRLLDASWFPQVLEVQTVVSDYLMRHFGQALDFQAILADPESAQPLGPGPVDKRFASITTEVLRRLGGKYADAADRLQAEQRQREERERIEAERRQREEKERLEAQHRESISVSNSSSEKMGGHIFISYRREDSRWSAGRLYDRLIVRYARDQILMDIDGIALGDDFVKTIEETVESCDVLIAVIGANWLTSTDEQGGRRLDNPEDFVRMEIATALRCDIWVIPVLVDGALMPRSTDLPDDLKLLVRRHALQFGDTHFDDDCRRLVAAIEQVLEKTPTEHRDSEERKRLEAERRERKEKERLEAQRRESTSVADGLATKMGGQIFISYRRDDSAPWARRLYDRLSNHSPSNQIFMDVDIFDPGVDFFKALEEIVASCDVLIAVIGKRWLISSDEQGRRRLDNAEDFVRIEIATALKRNIRVIPVLVDGALMPQSRDLPDDLKALVRRNALQLSHERFRADSERLASAVERALERTAAERRQREEKERLEAERRETEAKERLEAERRQKEEQEQLEAERLEAEQRERERLDVERREQERLEAERYHQYEILRREDGSLWELGRGAMGITYKAYDTNLRFTVALKVINSAYLGESETARQRFLREARAAAALRHSNVASVFNLGTEQDNYFYVTEFIDGETVDAYVKRKGPLEPAEALNIALQVARVLAVAAKQQLVHRDLKPTKLMLVDQEGESIVKVIDFGLAKVPEGAGEDSGALTMDFVGTPHFASPEQVEEGDVDIRSDIYSLGATLYFVLTGQPPFSGSVAQVMSQHLYKPLPMAPLASLPKCVVSLLQHMMEKDRNNRPQTAQDLQKAILACLEEIRRSPDKSPHQGRRTPKS